MAVNVPGLIAVIVFYLLILFIGLWAARKAKKKSNEELMLAGRNIGLSVGIFTMTATWFSGGFINGTAEVIYSSELVWCQAPFGYAASLCFGGYFFASRMRSHGYVTMLDPLQQKYGERMGALLYLPPLMGEIFWTAAILGAVGSTLAVIIDLQFEVSVAISTSIAVLYTLFGGLYSVAYTDVLQFLFISFGLWFTVPFAIRHKAVADINVNATMNWIKNVDPKQSGHYLDSFLLLILGGIAWQVYFQRVLSARTTQIAERLSYFAGCTCILMTIPALLIGVIAAQTNWNETTYNRAHAYELSDEDARYVLPLVMQYLCPAAVSFLGLGAVAAAVMSSADSSILAASGMFSRNIYRALFRPDASDRELNWVMRVTIFFIGAAAAVLAIQVHSIYNLFVLCSDFVYVMLFPQLTCVVYFVDMNTYGSLAGYIVGLFFRLAGGEHSLGFPPLLRYPWYDEDDNLQLFPYKTFAMLSTFIFIFIISYATKFIFERSCLPEKYDIFKCIVNFEGKSEHTRIFNPNIEEIIEEPMTEDIVEQSGYINKNFELSAEEGQDEDIICTKL